MYNSRHMDKIVQITVDRTEVEWAIEVARRSIAKWVDHEGYYTNRIESHLKGKLGELAVEKYLLEAGHAIDSHFRFADREKLSDIVVKIRKYAQVCRLEVKTWSRNYWAELGRCIAVEQYPDLKKKADLIVWCVLDAVNVADLLTTPAHVTIALTGWSRIGEIASAPVKDTGTGKMRKVKNYQFAESDLHPIQELLHEFAPGAGAAR